MAFYKETCSLRVLSPWPKHSCRTMRDATKIEPSKVAATPPDPYRAISAGYQSDNSIGSWGAITREQAIRAGGRHVQSPACMSFRPSKLEKLRHRAFVKQLGCCYYCGVPMIKGSSFSTFCQKYSLTEHEAQMLQCTAEHLVARCDGGTDNDENVVAACLRCNSSRHQLANGRPPQEHMLLVRACMRANSWHSPRLLGVLARAHDSRPHINRHPTKKAPPKHKVHRD